MSYLAIIPARGGSKGIPGKNLRLLAGKPLITWSIEQANACRLIERVVVSTDTEAIADIARTSGAEVPFLRPSSLATDTTATEPVIKHALCELTKRGYHPDAVILLQPTSPLRLPDTLATAIGQFERSGADSLLGVCANEHFFWKQPSDPVALYDYHNRPRRQDIAEGERWYRENGSIYISRTDSFMQSNNRLNGKIEMFVMSQSESYEIDTFDDLVVVEALLQQYVGVPP